MLKKKHNRMLRKNYCIRKIKNNVCVYNKHAVLLNNGRTFLNCTVLYTFNKVRMFAGNLNICSVTGKYKTVFNCLKLSRHTIRHYSNNDSIANFSKLN